MSERHKTKRAIGLRRRPFALLVLGLLAGCSTVGDAYRQAPSAPQGQALVHLARGRTTIGFAWSTDFRLNDKHIVSLHDKGYSWVHVPAGRHVFEAGKPLQAPLRLEINVMANTTYYLEYGQQVSGGQYRDTFRMLPKELGEAAIPTYQFKPAEL